MRIAPGVRINLSKSGVSTSIGGKGATVNLSKKGTRTTVGIPGSGLSYSHLDARKPTAHVSDYIVSSEPKAGMDPLVSAVLCCVVSAILVAVCQLPAMDSALINGLIYGLAGFSLLFLALAIVKRRQDAAIARMVAAARERHRNL